MAGRAGLWEACINRNAMYVVPEQGHLALEGHLPGEQTTFGMNIASDFAVIMLGHWIGAVDSACIPPNAPLALPSDLPGVDPSTSATASATAWDKFIDALIEAANDPRQPLIDCVAIIFTRDPRLSKRPHSGLAIRQFGSCFYKMGIQCFYVMLDSVQDSTSTHLDHRVIVEDMRDGLWQVHLDDRRLAVNPRRCVYPREPVRMTDKVSMVMAGGEPSARMGLWVDDPDLRQTESVLASFVVPTTPGPYARVDEIEAQRVRRQIFGSWSPSEISTPRMRFYN